MQEKSYKELFKKHDSNPVNDTLDLRIDFMESVMVDVKGRTLTMHDTHIEMQKTAFEWEQENIQGLIRCPFGLGKSTQIAVALTAYHHTLDKSLVTILNSANPDRSEEKVRAIRQIINENPNYPEWCRKNGIQPMEYSTYDNNAASQIFLQGNTTGRPSIEGVSVMGGGVGQRCHRMVYDDVVDQQSQESASHRDKVFKRIRNTWNSRLFNKETDTIVGVFTPWHKDDANMRFIKSGQFAELMIRINDDETGFELFEYRPVNGERKLHRKETGIDLWSFGGFTTNFLRREKAGDEIDYKRNYRMEEDAVDDSNSVYKHYSDEYEQYDDEGRNTGGNVTDRTFYIDGKAPGLVCDFNVGLQGWSLVQQQGTFHVVCKEFPGENMTTPSWAKHVAEELRKMGVTHIIVYGDATSKKTGRFGKSDYYYIKQALQSNGIRYTIKVPKSNPLEDERVNAVNDALRGQDGQRFLLVNENCHAVREDFKKVTTNDAGRIDKKKDLSLTHLSDGIGYYVTYEMSSTGRVYHPKLR